MELNERTIFEAALQIDDTIARAAYLTDACGDNTQLRSKVESLLQSHDSAGSFLDIPAVEQPGHQLIDSANTVLGNGDDEDEPLDISFLKPSTTAGSIGTLDHYEILEILGHGGFGVVFKAFDEKLHRHVAIKTMNVQMAATSPPRKRFVREARAAGAIRDENVVQVYSVEEKPLPYLVMEFIAGQTLQERQRDLGPLPVGDLLHIGRQIASGLAAAHEQSLIHRDVKPGNILLENGTQKIKITDFGLARAADDASLTRSGVISGTPLYMAPEQAMGKTLDHRSDLFSLGSVLYELTTGRPPFRAPSTVAVLRRVADDTQRPIQDIIPETPDWLVTIIEKLLQKNPDDRFQSAHEVADLMAQCQSEWELNGSVTCVKQFVGLSNGIAQPESEARSATQLSRTQKIVICLIPLLMVFPIVFGKSLAPVVNSWIWPAIPTLPPIELQSGLKFDGQDDYVEIPVSWSDPQFTIDVFVTTDKAQSGGTVFELSNGQKGKQEETFRLFQGKDKEGKPLCFAGIAGNNGFFNAYGPFEPGVREHRAITYDGTQLNYYINGVWQGKRNVKPLDELLWKMKRLTIGCNTRQSAFFCGTIDQLRVSKVARYSGYTEPVVASVSTDDATLALYNFDEGEGTVVKDSSGNGNDGQNFGGTWLSLRGRDQSRLGSE